MSEVRFEGWGVSEVGRRANNEDAWLADPTLGLFVVADGMGGYEGGEIASRTVVSTLNHFFGRTRDTGLADPTDGHAVARSRMDLAMRIAHREIMRQRVGHLAQMGSTAVAMLAHGDHMLVAHVGDSRLYRLREDRLDQLTRDHSLYSEMQSAGLMALPGRHECGFSHVITRALGAPGDSRADLRVESVRPGDLFVLCSDGLTDAVSDEMIELVATESPRAEVARTLADLAYRRGSSDNITVVVASAS